MSTPDRPASVAAPRERSRRRLVVVSLSLLIVLAGLAVAALFAVHGASRPKPEGGHANSARIVSLAPAVTQTLFALGAGPRVVGVSNYCRFPPEAAHRPRVGSAITPAFETIARLSPTLIVASEVGGEQLGPLSRIARTERLPWLKLEEVVSSTRKLGQLVGEDEAGAELAARLERTLGVASPPDAPRVLLTMSYGDVSASEVWFLRDDSLHGAALRAAGGRNAVPADSRGQPRLSLEEVLRLDPDQIVLLVDSDVTGSVSPDAVLAAWRRLAPLTAVKKGRVGVVRAPGALDAGPRILDVVAPLAAEITRLSALR